MPSIRFDRVSKIFEGFAAVDRLDLGAEDGEFLILVGPSGSGKTTALRLLAGLEGVSDGRILIGDTDVTRMRPQERNIAMVFQDYALYPQMTVEKNMGFALLNRGESPETIRRKVGEAAEKLGLTPMLQRKPGQLSGGQRQRVALGRAIVREPAVFLMDEPLSNLDAGLRTAMRGEIRRLQHELGTTTVYVTHDQVEAMTMGDRVAVMHQGRLRQAGSPREVYQNPADAFVASFIGSPAMNLLPATVTNAGGGRTALLGGTAAIALGNAELPERIQLGVRPENVALWGTAPNLVGPIAGRVALVEDLGREWFAELDIEGGKLTLLGQGMPLPRIGQSLEVGLHPEALHLFSGDELATRLPYAAARSETEAA